MNLVAINVPASGALDLQRLLMDGVRRIKTKERTDGCLFSEALVIHGLKGDRQRPRPNIGPTRGQAISFSDISLVSRVSVKKH